MGTFAFVLGMAYEAGANELWFNPSTARVYIRKKSKQTFYVEMSSLRVVEITSPDPEDEIWP